MTAPNYPACEVHLVTMEHEKGSVAFIRSWVQQLNELEPTFREVSEFMSKHFVRDICFVRDEAGNARSIILTLAEAEFRSFVVSDHPGVHEVSGVKTVKASTLAELDENVGRGNQTAAEELDDLFRGLVCPVNKDTKASQRFPDASVAVSISTDPLEAIVVGHIEMICAVSAAREVGEA